MANIAPPQLLLEAPPPPPRPYGLFDVALGPMDFPSPPAVGGGVMYVPDTCEDDVYLYSMQCPEVSGSKSFVGVEAAISGAPFAVVTSYSCGSIGYSFREAEQRVRTRMMLREQRAVERRLWQGQSSAGLGLIPGLFQNATTLTAASCPTEAVASLDQALADNGIVGGIIHARPYMSAHLANSHLIYKDGRTCRTYKGTPVVFGDGYNGTGPAGQAVTSTVEYMYASGRVLIWATPDTFVAPPGEVMNRTTNEVETVGEKIYAVIVECGVWAIAVTRDCSTAGTTA